MTVHLTETELADNIHTVLARIRGEGLEGRDPAALTAREARADVRQGRLAGTLIVPKTSTRGWRHSQPAEIRKLPSESSGALCLTILLGIGVAPVFGVQPFVLNYSLGIGLPPFLAYSP